VKLVIPITRSPKFAAPDADLREQRKHWHELLDAILDSGDSDLLRGLVSHLRAYGAIVSGEFGVEER
jgi:hypothetical protein